MAAVEQVDFGVRDVVGKGERARGTEDLVVAAPRRHERHPAGTKLSVQLRIQREIAGVVGEQPHLDQVIAGPRDQRVVVIPSVRADPLVSGTP